MIHDVTMNTILVNCRSLKNKLTSLVDNFRMNKTSLAILTETWFTRGDKLLRSRLENIQLESNVQVIRRDRNSRGGGLAIAFNREESSFNKLKLKSLVGCRFEILAVGGKLHGQKTVSYTHLTLPTIYSV